MSHDHHEEKAPELKDLIPFTLIICAVFAYVAVLLSQGGLKKEAQGELQHATGFEQVQLGFKGKYAILSGHVATASLKEEAEVLVSSVRGVAGIRANDIEIGLKSEPVTLAVQSPENHGNDEHSPEPQHAKTAVDHSPEEPAKVDDQPTEPEPALPAEASHPADSHADRPAKKQGNAFTTLLQQEKGKSLTITAHVIAKLSNQHAITEANGALSALKEEIAANGAVDANRIHTSIDAQLADQYIAEATTFSYVIE